jgi:hypothetical protein
MSIRHGGSFQAWRQLLEERQHVATLQLAAYYHLANGINSVWLLRERANEQAPAKRQKLTIGIQLYRLAATV